MDIQEKYKEETGIKAYDTSKQKYKIDYVIWLENRIEQLPIHDVSQRSELLSDFMGYMLENGYLNRQKLKDFIVQDYLISLNCG